MVTKASNNYSNFSTAHAMVQAMARMNEQWNSLYVDKEKEHLIPLPEFEKVFEAFRDNAMRLALILDKIHEIEYIRSNILK